MRKGSYRPARLFLASLLYLSHVHATRLLRLLIKPLCPRLRLLHLRNVFIIYYDRPELDCVSMKVFFYFNKLSIRPWLPTRLRANYIKLSYEICRIRFFFFNDHYTSVRRLISSASLIQIPLNLISYDVVPTRRVDVRNWSSHDTSVITSINRFPAPLDNRVPKQRRSRDLFFISVSIINNLYIFLSYEICLDRLPIATITSSSVYTSNDSLPFARDNHRPTRTRKQRKAPRARGRDRRLKKQHYHIQV